MSWNQSEVLEARRLIVETARSILAGETTAIEGARSIVRSCSRAKLENDPDIVPFIAIESETETLPLGGDRQYLQAKALADLEPEIEKAQPWARGIATARCQNLVNREALLLRWPD
ncbi:hypothetical protein [Bradyrhizobium sp. USDA 4454]